MGWTDCAVASLCRQCLCCGLLCCLSVCVQRLPSACSVRRSSARASSIWVNCASVSLAPVALCAGTGAATAFSLSLSLPSVLGTGQVDSSDALAHALSGPFFSQQLYRTGVCSVRVCLSMCTAGLCILADRQRRTGSHKRRLSVRLQALGRTLSLHEAAQPREDWRQLVVNTHSRVSCTVCAVEADN